jgi:hypothetical protein
MAVKIDGTLGIDKIKDGSVTSSDLIDSINLPGSPTVATPAPGTNSNQLATTAFAYGTSSKATNGYQKLPSGLIIQWGRGSINANLPNGGYGTTSVNFPVAFPNSLFTISIVGNDNSVGAQSQEGFFSYISRSNSSFTVNYSQVLGSSNGGSGETTAFDWVAIGY